MEEGIKGDELPHILTISEFASQLAKKLEAGKIELLFILYKAYLEIIGSDGKSIDFESFRSWGETIISDFNTVDLYLANPKEIFKNIVDYRNISANYLTDEQKEVMKEYFGVEEFGDPETFWQHFSSPDIITDTKSHFLSLWQVLAPLHARYVDMLSERGLGSTGTIYRSAVENLKERGEKIIPYQKIVFVGFNALTNAEREIFKILRKMKDAGNSESKADFIWDLEGPFFELNNFSASRFVSSNKKYFPSPEWLQMALDKNKPKDYPDIEIIASPSLTAQAKVAGELLKPFGEEENKKLISNAEVALILPDETLMGNVLYSLPDTIGDVNLTMGFSLKLSAIASFMALVRPLLNNRREKEDSIVYYSRDLKRLMGHPYSYELFDPEMIDKLIEFINSQRKIVVDSQELEKKIPEFNTIFFKIEGEKAGIFDLISNLLNVLSARLQNRDSDNLQDRQQIEIYGEYISGFKETLENYKIELSDNTILRLIDKLIASEKMGFEGEPVAGLQIMGTLETRVLDFKHVIILSMNEGVMPGRSIMPTFIPDTLRIAYGLPPARYAEEIFGYYFYRLISRAEKVTLIYDGRTVSGLRGGVSRYILQLRHYMPESKLHESSWQYRLQNQKTQEVRIVKSPEIMEKLESFTTDDGNLRKNFSASSLNTYRECQIKFFLQSLLNLNADPEREEYIDPITAGNILHRVMMELYMPYNRKKLLKNPIVVDKKYLENILKNPDRIRKSITKSLNWYYYGIKSDEPIMESGATEMVSQQIEELVTSIINYDLTLTPFNLYGCEIAENMKVKLSSGRVVNFRFAIDRLDEIEIDGKKRLRIVDYKTGSKKRYAKSIEEIFEGGYQSEQIFQLFVYAWLLGKKGVTGWEDVITEIYYVPDLLNGRRGLPEIEKKAVESFRPYIEKFEEYLEKMIEDIFTSSEFKDTKHKSMCSYCGFNNYCETR